MSQEKHLAPRGGGGWIRKWKRRRPNLFRAAVPPHGTSPALLTSFPHHRASGSRRRTLESESFRLSDGAYGDLPLDDRRSRRPAGRERPRLPGPDDIDCTTRTTYRCPKSRIASLSPFYFERAFQKRTGLPHADLENVASAGRAVSRQRTHRRPCAPLGGYSDQSHLTVAQGSSGSPGST